ncbi:unnamed protein product [Phaedon cochleariae]|uniref:PHD-type domain-containing protein n=1 Tax=Phaedon cochleariae TaxID=80249 RepID=A0A9N9X3L8_PHACE|nr:unnamed protein product [Phaedon cochleariae]
MSTTCASCTTLINKKSPGVQCDGFCAASYHAKCIGLTIDQVNLIKDCRNTTWMCDKCRNNDSSETGLHLTSPGTTIESKMQQQILNFMQDIKCEVKELRGTQADLIKSITFCTDKISDFESTLKSFNDQIKNIEKLKTDNQYLTKNVQSLNKKVSDLEQFSRMNNIEIQGVPDKKNEDIYKIIDTIHKSLGIQITSSMIDSAHRVASFSSNKPKNIVVKYTTRRIRDDILSAAKVKRMASTSRIINIEGISNNLFIVEHLSPGNKSLYKKTRDFATSNNYKFVWVKNGSILIRKDEGSNDGARRDKFIQVVLERVEERSTKNRFPIQLHRC